MSRARVRLVRSGGFANVRLTGELAVSALAADERAGAELLASLTSGGTGAPDRFVYRLTLSGEQAVEVVLDEPSLPDALRPLVARLEAAGEP